MRTEQDVLNDFEKLGWKVTENDDEDLTLRYSKIPSLAIWVDKNKKCYSSNTCIDIQEHKILNELFYIWNWI